MAVTILGSTQSEPAFQTIAYASIITPSAANGAVAQIGTLTGDMTVDAPSSPQAGQVLTMIFTQDGTGGHIVTFNTIYSNGMPVDTAANAVTVVSFVYDGIAWR